jgi:hypothetical protein
MKSISILRTITFVLLFFFATVTISLAKQFEIFDGRLYNGLYYPRIDIIEWGTPAHLEFHIYQKDKQIDMAAVPGDKNGKPVLWLNYYLDYRNENICRHVIAPEQFKEGDTIYAYKDITPTDFDIIYVSTHPLTFADSGPKAIVPNYTLKPYFPCNDEMASNKPDATRMPASETKSAEVKAAPAEKKEGKSVGVDYENAAVPFSF